MLLPLVSYLICWKCQIDALGLDLLLEQILLVEEDDEGHLGKVRVVDHFVEKVKTLLHSIRYVILPLVNLSSS